MDIDEEKEKGGIEIEETLWTVLILLLTVSYSPRAEDSSASSNGNNGGGANVAGSGNSGNGDAGGNSGGEQAKKHAIVFKNTGNPYGEKMIEGFREAMGELGHEVISRSPDDLQPKRKFRLLRN